jgi:DNA-binding response OmpR family regulator
VARILIVEESQDLGGLFARFLAQRGHSVALHGTAAVWSRFDLLLLEPTSPGGLEIAAAVRAHQPNLPIVCTAAHPPTAAVRALAPAAYLTKPVHLDVLARAVGHALRPTAGIPVAALSVA